MTLLWWQLRKPWLLYCHRVNQLTRMTDPRPCSHELMRQIFRCLFKLKPVSWGNLGCQCLLFHSWRSKGVNFEKGDGTVAQEIRQKMLGQQENGTWTLCKRTVRPIPCLGPEGFQSLTYCCWTQGKCFFLQLGLRGLHTNCSENPRKHRPEQQLLGTWQQAWESHRGFIFSFRRASPIS